MRLTIRQKLALVLALFSLCLVATMYLGVRASFRQGFLEYINQSLEIQANQIAQYLSESYASPQAWNRLTERARLWHEIRRRLPGHIRETLQDNLVQGLESTPGLRQSPLMPKLRGRPPGLPIKLLDSRLRTLHGPNEQWRKQKLFPIEAAGITYGYVAVRSLDGFTTQADQLFVEQQNKLFRTIALAAVLVSLLLSWPLAAVLVGPVQRISAAMHDLTQRRYNSRVRIRSRDELGRLAQEFNQMAHTLGEYDKTQRQWLADIAHELRTPLAVLQGELEAMQDGIRPLDQRALESLSQEVNQLKTLVADLHQLTLSELGGLRYQFDWVDAQKLLENIQRQAQHQLAKAQLSLTIQVKGHLKKIWADEQRLQQLLMNLLQNSLRYTDPGGQIQIQVYCHKRLYIDWEDSSPGVPEDQLQKLFQPLFRVDKSRSRQLGGSGLGLAIVEKIIQAHQGKLYAATSDLGGLKIHLVLPLQPFKTSKKAPGKPVEPKLTTNHPLTQNSLADQLMESRYNPHATKNSDC